MRFSHFLSPWYLSVENNPNTRMAFIKRKIDWTAPVVDEDAGLEMTPEQNPYIAEVEANETPGERSWEITFTQGENTGNEVLVKVTQPPVYKHTICYYDKEGSDSAIHTSGATIILCADSTGRVKIGQGTISEEGCCEIISSQDTGYAFACGAREWSEYGNEIWVSDGTEEGKYNLEENTPSYPIYTECEIIRKISSSATYQGSLSIWASAKDYVNNMGPFASTAGSSCVFYMTETSGKEECEILSVEPEVNITTDIYQYNWDYIATGVDETDDNMLPYRITVSPKSDTGVTGTFTLEPPYQQILGLKTNVPTGTPVYFYSGDSSTKLDTQQTAQSGNGATASTTIVGCEEKIEETSFKVKVDYELKTIISPVTSTEFEIDPLVARFNSDCTVDGDTAATEVIINVQSTSSSTDSIREFWEDGSANGIGYANSGNDYVADIRIVSETTPGETVQLPYSYTISYDEVEPDDVIDVYFSKKNSPNAKITGLTLPNTVSSNEDASQYYDVHHTKNGVVQQTPAGGYNVYNARNIEKNTNVGQDKYLLTAEYLDKEATLEIAIEPDFLYNVQIIPTFTFNRTGSITTDEVWYVRISDTDQNMSYSQVSSAYTNTINNTESFYLLDCSILDSIKFEKGKEFKITVSSSPTSNVMPKFKYNGYNNTVQANGIECMMHMFEGPSDINILTSLGNNKYKINNYLTSRNLVLNINILFNY